MAHDQAESDDPWLDIRRFLQERIENVEQLEILLFLYWDASRFWDAASVAESIHLTERQVADHLETLGRQGLLDVRIASTVLYRFNPAAPDLARSVERLTRAYRERRSDVLAFLQGRHRRSLKDFSDAFRFTKGPRDA